jgi:hypothetical protein
LSDVRKSINFCRQLNLPILGVVENMSGFTCPKCGEYTAIFKQDGGEHLAGDMGVPFLGRIPIDPALVESCDSGQVYIHHMTGHPASAAFDELARSMAAALS